MTRLHFNSSPLNFTIKPGDVWGILGPNGCGKTTLLKTLAGLSSIQSGDVFLNDQSLSSLPLKKIAQTIGFLFQEMQLNFPQTVEAYCLAARYPHLSYFKKMKIEDEQIMRQALEEMDLTSKAKRLIRHLSGGERRRVAIAALLTQAPTIYLLDEPTNHLDIHHQIQVLTYLQKLAQSKQISIMMALHDINLAARFCDHIVLLYPNGQRLQGESKHILTAEHLTQLYQHPIVSTCSSWQPLIT